MYSSPGILLSKSDLGGMGTGDDAVTPGAVSPSSGKSSPMPCKGGALSPPSLAAELGVSKPLLFFRATLPSLKNTPHMVGGEGSPSAAPSDSPPAVSSSLVVKVGEGGEEVGGGKAEPHLPLTSFCSRGIVGLACMAILLALALGLGLGLGLKPTSSGVATLASPTPSPAPSASSKMANVTKWGNVVSVLAGGWCGGDYTGGGGAVHTHRATGSTHSQPFP
jgi:hypothetical protein